MKQLLKPAHRRLQLAFAALLFCCGTGMAAENTIGVAAPLSGSGSILGQQLLSGVQHGVAPAGQDVLAVDTSCTPEGGRATAEAMKQADVRIAVGFLCSPALEAALPILREAGISTIAVGPRKVRLTAQREKTGNLVWRLAPEADAEARALATYVRENWSGTPFTIAEDGSLQARELADQLRIVLAESGIEPNAIENYSPAEGRQFPLARRLAQSGVTRLLALGTREDTAIILRDAASLDVQIETLGGENLLDDAGTVELPQGVRAVAIVSMAYAADPALEGYFSQGQAAGEIAATALQQSADTAISDTLNSAEFATTIGPVRFDGEGNANLPAFGVVEWRNGRFNPVPEG
ncbi:ABC transporter substrate-binding protein [Aureimonas fodinaquatilis]|nr:ABC transporter substrate-binding protein [Aureimonas fodinaquatilis]